MSSADRKREYRNGVRTLRLRVDLLWAAEALAQAGYGHPDADGLEEVQAAAQRLFDDLIAEAKGDVPNGTSRPP